MMKRMLIDATGSSSWIGGLYHKKNIVFSLLQNEWIRGNMRIYIVTNPDHKELFKEFGKSVRINCITYKGLREKKLKLLLLSLIHRCHYVFPVFNEKACRLFGITGINWTPDYQHYHYKDFFPEEEYNTRVEIDRSYASSSFPLLLSSRACLDDFREFCSKEKSNIYVVPFVSYIKSELTDITDGYLNEVCDKYNISPKRYILISNQFWKHKNHIVALEAINNLSGRGMNDIRIVLTGNIRDYRNNEYIARIKEILDDEVLKKCCVCTGFIDRREQLALMKGAKFIIQPSLFEGWGTVLEDAKVLDKTVLLSDIPVHREQMNDKCILFDPHDADALADKIEEIWNNEYTDDMEAGIAGMYERAGLYSKGFERLLKENS